MGHNIETSVTQQFATDGVTSQFLLRGSYVCFILRGDGPIAARLRLQTREDEESGEWYELSGSECFAQGVDSAFGLLNDGYFYSNALRYGRVLISNIERGPLELAIASSYDPIIKAGGPSFRSEVA